MGTQWHTTFWAPESLKMVTAAMKLRCLLLRRKAMTNLDRHIRKQRHHFTNKAPSSQSCGFSSSHVWMWELDYKESWAPGIDTFELWCWRRLLRVPWTLKEISPECSLVGRTDVEAETSILWPLHAKSWLIWKDPDAGKDWRWEEKGSTEDETVRWHHQLNGHEFE